MINISKEGQASFQQEKSENREVQKGIAQIRGARVMKFVDQSIEDGGHLVDAVVDINEKSEKGEDTSEEFRKAGKSVGSIYEGAKRVASDGLEHVKEKARQGEWGQSIRWYLLDHGSSAKHDSRIAKQKQKVENLEDKKQREARQFDELQQKFSSGKMNEMDIERSKREHLKEFEERVEKEKVALAKEESEKVKHLQEVQELKNRINDRIEGEINKIKFETNYDLNEKRQGELKGEIKKAEGLLSGAKKTQKELEIKCKLLYADSWTSKVLNKSVFGYRANFHKKESDVFGDMSPEELKALSPEQKAEIKNAKAELQKRMKDEEVTLSNVALEIREAMDAHAVEVERLESNLAKLRAAKDPIDTELIKANARIGKFKTQRKSFRIKDKVDGLANEDVGEHVKVEGFENAQEIKDNNDNLFGNEIAELDAKIKSPEALFGKGAAFNFKVTGFENFSNTKKNTEILLSIRSETDQTIFKLEKTITKIESTVDSGVLEEKDKPEVKKQIEALEVKIAELKKNIIDKIQVDKDGKLDEDVDQVTLLKELCPDLFMVSDDKSEVFGNKLETEEEKEEGLETLKLAIAEIDALSDPLARLKGYTETVAFGLNNKLRLDLDKEGVDQIYNSIVGEKIQQLIREIDNTNTAVEVGFNAIKTLADSGFSPMSSSAMINSITFAITEKIKNEADPVVASTALLSFTEKYCELNTRTLEELGADASPTELIYNLGVAQKVVDRMKTDSDTYTESRKIADFVFQLSENSNGKISLNLIKRLFDSGILHLKNNPEVVEGLVEDKINMYDSSSAIYDETYRYIQQKMVEAGIGAEEIAEKERSKEAVSIEISRLIEGGNPNEIAQYAVTLARENKFPDEVIRATYAAQSACGETSNNQNTVDGNKLRLVADIFSAVGSEFNYQDRSKELYDIAFDALKNQPNDLMNSYRYLIDSLERAGYEEKISSVVESVAENLLKSSTGSVDSLNKLDTFMDMCNVYKSKSEGGDLSEVSLKLAKGMFDRQVNMKLDKGNIVSLLEVINKNGFSEASTEMFLNHINSLPVEGDGAGHIDAYLYLPHLSENSGFESSARIKFGEAIVKKVGEYLAQRPENEKIDNLMTLHRQLTNSDFDELASSVFENNLDLANQETIVNVIDKLSEGDGLYPGQFKALIGDYVPKAIEMTDSDFEKTVDLMAHWADRNNDSLHVPVIAVARKLANKDFDKLLKLATVMNEHNVGVGLGLEQSILEAEVIAKDKFSAKGFEVDTGFEELERVLGVFKLVKDLEGQAKRLEGEIEEMKTESVGEDILNENIFTSDSGFNADSIESAFPGASNSLDANFAGKAANQPPKKQGSAVANFIRGLFGR